MNTLYQGWQEPEYQTLSRAADRTYKALYSEEARAKWETIWALAQVDWTPPEGSDNSLSGSLNEAGYGDFGPM